MCVTYEIEDSDRDPHQLRRPDRTVSISFPQICAHEDLRKVEEVRTKSESPERSKDVRIGFQNLSSRHHYEQSEVHRSTRTRHSHSHHHSYSTQTVF